MLYSKTVTTIQTTLMDQAAFVDYNHQVDHSHLVKYSNLVSGIGMPKFKMLRHIMTYRLLLTF